MQGRGIRKASGIRGRGGGSIADSQGSDRDGGERVTAARPHQELDISLVRGPLEWRMG